MIGFIFWNFMYSLLAAFHSGVMVETFSPIAIVVKYMRRELKIEKTMFNPFIENIFLTRSVKDTNNK